MSELENLRKAILEEYPRLGPKDKFRFACYPGISCFNDCCSDVNIFLTPYDIIRMKNRLGISSEEFLVKYTLAPIGKSQKHPVVMLRMADDENKSCRFVTAEGCSIYSDRPWSCRMYPLGMASPLKNDPGNEKFYFIMREDVCRGFEEAKEWTVEEWMDDQEIGIYNEMGELFQEVSLHPFFEADRVLTPDKIEMFHMVCYNIDKFRRFLFESTFFDRFEVEPGIIERIGDDDLELFKFGIKWLKFSLFGERTMEIKGEKRFAD